MDSFTPECAKPLSTNLRKIRLTYASSTRSTTPGGSRRSQHRSTDNAAEAAARANARNQAGRTD